MNILFLTLADINSLDERGIYQDLLRKFVSEGHNITILTPVERQKKTNTQIISSTSSTIVKIKTLNIQKTNIIEKGIGTLIIEYQFLSAIKKYLKNIKFDLILYSTPPITFGKVISYIKNRDEAHTYLLLKDIFPQNAVDIGLIKPNSFIERFFRKKEKRLYSLSDFIGCMSPANVDFLLKHNKDLMNKSIEVCPNSIEIDNRDICEKNRIEIRKKYGIPTESCVFIYGGNLGKPQGLEFLLQVLQENRLKSDRFFLIVGSGTEYQKIERWFNANSPENAKLLKGLPKEEYDCLVQACDVGLIFLSPHFTIPNYPSRLLSYLENKMPVLMATDENTDIGPIAQNNQYGYWTKSGDVTKFNGYLNEFCNNKELILEMGKNGYDFLRQNYTVEQSYNIIMKHFSN